MLWLSQFACGVAQLPTVTEGEKMNTRICHRCERECVLCMHGMKFEAATVGLLVIYGM